jgi:hypothetical protein
MDKPRHDAGMKARRVARRVIDEEGGKAKA